MTVHTDEITTQDLHDLLERRIHAWEQAEPRSRREHEQAEAFTRAYAELDAALKDQGRLPRQWRGAQPWVPGPDDEPLPASEMPRVITDDIALNMTAAILTSMGLHSLAYELRMLLPAAEGKVHGQQYQEAVGKWGAYLTDEVSLPKEGTPETGETMVNWPDDARKLRDHDGLARENAELKAEVQQLKAQLDQAERRNTLMVPAMHMPDAMAASLGEAEGTIMRATDDPSIEFELREGTWHPRR
jgi:hypothetical protein